MPYCANCRDDRHRFDCAPCATCAVCSRVVKYESNPGDLETDDVFCSPEHAAEWMVKECDGETDGLGYDAFIDTAYLLGPRANITDPASREFITRTLERLCKMELERLSHGS